MIWGGRRRPCGGRRASRPGLAACRCHASWNPGPRVRRCLWTAALRGGCQREPSSKRLVSMPNLAVLMWLWLRMPLGDRGPLLGGPIRSARAQLKGPVRLRGRRGEGRQGVVLEEGTAGTRGVPGVRDQDARDRNPTQSSSCKSSVAAHTRAGPGFRYGWLQEPIHVSLFLFQVMTEHSP